MKNIIRDYIIYRLTYDMDDYTREHVRNVLVGNAVVRPLNQARPQTLEELAELDPEYALYL